MSHLVNKNQQQSQPRQTLSQCFAFKVAFAAFVVFSIQVASGSTSSITLPIAARAPSLNSLGFSLNLYFNNSCPVDACYLQAEYDLASLDAIYLQTLMVLPDIPQSLDSLWLVSADIESSQSCNVYSMRLVIRIVVFI